MLLNDMNESDYSFFLRNEMAKEKMLKLDFSYMQSLIDHWWDHENQAESIFILKTRLIYLLVNHLKSDDLNAFKNLGTAKHYIAAVCIQNIFLQDSPKLSLVVHEAFSELFHITDIQYEYEEHKTLFLKQAAIDYKDWGSGYGEITPHSDDLYENLNIDYLSLTICRDRTKTPTRCFFPRDILRNFTDQELFRLRDLKAKFTSGKNVSVLIHRTRNILDYSEKYGFRFFLDFRIDKNTGERMQACLPEDQYLLDKMRAALEDCPFESSIPETGTFFIVANHKVLHARAQMNIEKEVAAQFSENPSMTDTPRLLYRSKGPRREYLAL